MIHLITESNVQRGVEKMKNLISGILLFIILIGFTIRGFEVDNGTNFNQKYEIDSVLNLNK